MDVKISGLGYVPRGKPSKPRLQLKCFWAPVQQCSFVLGQINIGKQTMNSMKEYHVNSCLSEDVRLFCVRMSMTFQCWHQGGAALDRTHTGLAHVQAPRPETWARPWCVTRETSAVLPDCWAWRTRRKGELEGREQGNWGEAANLVIMSAAAANSTSPGKVETEQHEITGVMKTARSVPHREDMGGDKLGDG